MADLKEIIKPARANWLPFAFCLGKKTETSVLMIEKNKPPVALQRIVKALPDTQSAKNVYGITKVVGRYLVLHCVESYDSSLQLKLKEFFAAAKVPQKPLLNFAGPQANDAKNGRSIPLPGDAASEPDEDGDDAAPVAGGGGGGGGGSGGGAPAAPDPDPVAAPPMGGGDPKPAPAARGPGSAAGKSGEELIAELDKDKADLATARRLLPGDARKIVELEKDIRSEVNAAKVDDARPKFDELMVLLATGRDLAAKLAAALAEADAAKAEAEALQASLEPRIVKPLPPVLRTPLGEAIRSLNLKDQIDPAKVTAAVAAARTTIGTVKTAGETMARDKAAWDLALPPVDQKVTTLRGHASKGEGGVRAKFDEIDKALIEAKNTAAKFDYAGATALLPDILTKVDAAQLLADAAGEYEALLRDRFSRVGKLPSAKKFPNIEAQVTAQRAKLKSAHTKAGKAGGHDYAGATVLLKEIGEALPVIETALVNAAEYDKLRKSVGDALAKQDAEIAALGGGAAHGVGVVDALLLPKARKFHTDSDIATTNDYRRSGDLLRQADECLADSQAQIRALKVYLDKLTEVKTEIAALKAHAGAAGIVHDLQRVDADVVEAEARKTELAFGAGIRTLMAAFTRTVDAKPKAEAYVKYLAVLAKSDPVEGADPTTEPEAVARELTQAIEWRKKAKLLAAASEAEDALEAAERAATFTAAVDEQRKAAARAKALADAAGTLGGGAAEANYAAAHKAYDDERKKIAAPARKSKLIDDIADEAAAFEKRAETAKKAADWATAGTELEAALKKLGEGVEAAASIANVDRRLKEVHAMVAKCKPKTAQQKTDTDALKAELAAADVLLTAGKFEEAEKAGEAVVIRADELEERIAVNGKLEKVLKVLDKAVTALVVPGAADANLQAAVTKFGTDVAAAKTQAEGGDEKGGLAAAEALVKQADLLKAKIAEWTAMDAFLTARAFWFTWYPPNKGTYPDFDAKLDAHIAAIATARGEMNFKVAQEAANAFWGDAGNLRELIQGNADVATAKAAADAAIAALTAKTCPPVAADIVALNAEVTGAVADGAKFLYPKAIATLNAIPAKTPPLEKRADDFKLYDPERAKAVAAIDELARLFPGQVTLAAQLKAFDGAKKKMERLAAENDFAGAKVVADALVADCAKAKTDAETQAKADKIAADTAAGAGDATKFDALWTEVKKLADDLAAHAGKAAITDRQKKLTETLDDAKAKNAAGDAAAAGRGLAEAGKQAAEALAIAIAAVEVGAAVAKIEARLTPLQPKVTEPPMLVALVASIDTALQKAKTDAATDAAVAALASLGPVGGDLDRAEDGLKGHADYIAARDDQAKTIATLEKHEQRYAIADNLTEIYTRLGEAARRDLSLEYKLVTAEQKTIADLIKIARLDADMHGDAKLTPKEVEEVLALPGGAKKIDAIMDTLDPKTQRDVAEVLLEKRFGFELKKYKDSKGAKEDKNTNKRAPDLLKLYKVLSKLPEGHASDNAELIDVALYGGGLDTSLYSPDDRKIELRIGNGDQQTSEVAGKVDEVGELTGDNTVKDPDKPVDTFDWTTLHEIAHALDDKLHYMQSKGKDVAMGGWQVYHENVTPVADAAAAHFDFDPVYIKSYLQRSKALPPPPDPARGCDPATEAGVAKWESRRILVESWCNSIRVNADVYRNASKAARTAIGGRCYQEAYDNSWVSYLADARKSAITGYQFRAPGEWFAELYAAFHCDKLNDRHPARAWLAAL